MQVPARLLRSVLRDHAQIIVILGVVPASRSSPLPPSRCCHPCPSFNPTGGLVHGGCLPACYVTQPHLSGRVQARDVVEATVPPLFVRRSPARAVQRHHRSMLGSRVPLQKKIALSFRSLPLTPPDVPDPRHPPTPTLSLPLPSALSETPRVRHMPLLLLFFFLLIPSVRIVGQWRSNARLVPHQHRNPRAMEAFHMLFGSRRHR